MANGRTLVVDGSGELQQWVDKLLALAEESGTQWDGDAHVADGLTVVSVASVWRAIEASFDVQGPDGEIEPWSIAQRGLPLLPDSYDLEPDPHPGGRLHNAWHAVRNAFH